MCPKKRGLGAGNAGGLGTTQQTANAPAPTAAPLRSQADALSPAADAQLNSLIASLDCALNVLAWSPEDADSFVVAVDDFNAVVGTIAAAADYLAELRFQGRLP
jgi:hypothetical protein